MQPRHSNRAAYAKRPLWRNYLFAYLLIGVGFSIGSVAVGPTGNRILEDVGTTLLFLWVFGVCVRTCSFFFWFVAGGKPPRNGAA